MRDILIMMTIVLLISFITAIVRLEKLSNECNKANLWQYQDLK